MKSRVLGPTLLALVVCPRYSSCQHEAHPLHSAAPRQHALPGAYIDPRHLTALPFGAHSHWLQPWRAYQETIPAKRFLDAQGAVLDLADKDNPELIAEMLARHGVRSVRIEIAWGFVNYFDETKLNFEDRLRATLSACRKHGLRPLILLNGNEGAPGPMDLHQKVLAARASKGDRQVSLTDVSDLKVGYSGLANLSGYRASEALIVGMDGNTLQLSKPLPKDLGEPGTQVVVTTLKYRPFADPGSEDYRATMEGWKRYVGTVAQFVTSSLGTCGKDDLGFDLEIWNELTFGSAFLSINNYYEPKLFTYNEETIWRELVANTADYVEKHGSDFRGVTLVDGFRNTIPWPAASQEPPRVGAMSFHPYPPPKRYPADEPAGPTINARFQQESPPAFKPDYAARLPEYFGLALQTETAIRDMAPLKTPIYDVNHGQDSRMVNGKAAPCPLWITEIGFHPAEHGGITERGAALRLKAKTTLRFSCFYAGKGVERVYFFSALNGDKEFGIVQDNFAAYARDHRQYPAPDTAYASPALGALGRMTAAIAYQVAPRLSKTRQLIISSVSDSHNHVQFKGDGTPEHPNLYNRDVFFITPLQVNAGRFALPYYVMTRNAVNDLTPETYTISIRGLNANTASVTAYDPITNRAVPAAVLGRTGANLTIKVLSADYPRLLIIQEKKPKTVTPVNRALDRQGSTL